LNRGDVFPDTTASAPTGPLPHVFAKRPDIKRFQLRNDLVLHGLEKGDRAAVEIDLRRRNHRQTLSTHALNRRLAGLVFDLQALY
jgi:hypothetical protein